jgi:hypothetical protein
MPVLSHTILWNDQYYTKIVDQLVLWNSETKIVFTSRLWKLWTVFWSLNYCFWIIFLNHMDSILKTELYIIYSQERFLLTNIWDFFKYLITSNLSMILPEVTELFFLLLTILITSVLLKLSFSALKRVCTYIWSTQTQERLTNLSLMTTVIDISTEKKSPNRTKYKV